MRAWSWLVARVPVVVTTRRRQWRRGKNAFEIGRDYERAQAAKITQ